MNLKILKRITSNLLFRKILKVLTYLALAFVILIAFIFIYFSIYKDDLSRDLLLKLNEIQKGEITFEEISLTPFEQFPRISLNLVNVSYFENKDLKKNKTKYRLSKFENIYLTFNLTDLLARNINVTNMTLQGGQIRILTYPDSSTNLGNAIASNVESVPVEELVIDEVDTLITDTELEKFLAIDNLRIKDVIVEFDNRIVERKIALHINNLSASFIRKVKRNELKLTGDLNLYFYQLKGITLLENKSFQLVTDMRYHEKEKLIYIEPSNLIFKGAKFNVIGSIDIEEDGEMDLEIKLTDKDFSILSLLFSEDVIYQNRKNLLKGDFNLEAKVSGKSFFEVPLIELNFGVKNVNLHMPKVGKSIRDLEFDGSLTTGYKQDLSEVKITLDNFRAKLPDGETRGRLFLENLKNPHIDLDWYLKTDLSGFNGVFKTDLFDSLNGKITIDVQIAGEVDLQKGRIIRDKDKTNLHFENVSIRFPDFIALDNVNGVIRRENKDLRFEEFRVITGKTDVTLNGMVNNIMFLPLNIESDITAELNLVSDSIDFSQIFAFNPSVGRNFNHVLKELDLKVTAKSTTTKLLNFHSFPAVDLKIDLLNACFDDFPDIKIIDSDISYDEDSSGFNINFDHLKILMANGELTLNGAYNGSAWKPSSLICKTQSKNIDMMNLLNEYKIGLDSTSFFNFILNGSFDTKIEFPKDSIKFKTLELADSDFTVYHLALDDTIISESLTIKLKDVSYDLEHNSNPMATLTTAGSIYAGRIRTKVFDESDLKFDVLINKGLYEIYPNSDRFFRTKGKGVIIAQPWSDVPTYRFKYTVERFAIEDWLANFMESPVLSGTMSFSMDAQMTGNNWDNMLKEVSGSTYNEGINLQLHGLDIDEVLENIERSKHFTLLDLAAVVFAGPIGLVVTKGLDLVVLVASDYGEVTQIQKMVSNWNISNGILETNDVAFATNKNRIAAQGHVNLIDKTLDITFAVLNEDGSCRSIQNIKGNLDDPEFGNIKIIESLLSPVTNLFEFVLPIGGDIFYEGSVKHPE